MNRVFIIGGSFISFAAGAGFATGQEVLQFYAAYGYRAFLSITLFLIFNIYVNLNFLEAGRLNRSEKSFRVFHYFCGKHMGIFFDWFAVMFCYMLFIVMIAGAGATLNQQYGIPVTPGAFLIAALASMTVVFGLQKMLDVIGIIGPVIIVFSIAASIVGVINGNTGIALGEQLAHSMVIMSAGNGWFSAVLTYCGFNMLMFAGFIAAIGRSETNISDARIGISLGVALFSIALGLVVLAILANIELVAQSQIPLLELLNNISPSLATVYSIIICFGIYSTATPLLWTVSNRLSSEGSRQYVTITLILALAGLVIGLSIPFNKLVNTIYVINGYIGFILFAFIVMKNITRSCLHRI